MTRAILITSVVLLLGIAVAITGLWLQRPARPARAVAQGRPPIPVPQSDGSLYDLRIYIAQLEDRLEQLETYVRELRDRSPEVENERNLLKRELESLKSELNRLRAEVEAARLQGAEPPANGPAPPPPPVPR